MKQIDKVIIFFILLMVFFLRYIQVFYKFWYIFDFLLIIYVTSYFFKEGKFSKKVNNAFLLSNLLLIVILMINISEFGFGVNFVNNFLMVFSPFTFLVYVYYLSVRYSYYELYKFGRNLLIFLNLYFLVNFPIIVIQYYTGDFMMKRFLSWGMFNFDHMTGLLGPFGTGIANVFWIALLMANLIYYNISKINKWLILLIIEIPLMMLLSIFNENKVFIPSLVFMSVLVLIYIYIISNSNLLEFLFKFLPIVILGSFLFFISYVSISAISDEVDKLFELADDFFSNAELNTHNERAYINYLAFKYYGASTLGAGLNQIDFENQSIHKNLGINSMTLLLIHGGVWYLLAVINFYAAIALKTVERNFNVSSIILYIVVFCVFLYFSFVTQPFRDHYVMYMISILVFYLTIYRKKHLIPIKNQNY